MSNKGTKKKVTKVESKKLDFTGVSNSNEEVVFIATKDHKGLKKGVEYTISLNVAEILTIKQLGNIKK
jgi:membrane protease subunit (stomatin/prohibitin family)|tara:strand:- start:5149 stop:5352 length:204 start_codon:yes stop_codon:yes gene_type:complete